MFGRRGGSDLDRRGHLNALSLNLYAGWRRFSYSDQLGNSYRDANGLLVGARWFF